jgi:hypothetical protein
VAASHTSKNLQIRKVQLAIKGENWLLNQKFH